MDAKAIIKDQTQSSCKQSASVSIVVNYQLPLGLAVTYMPGELL